MSLIVRMIKDGKIENHFLDLLQRFLNVSDCLRENELDIKRTRFAGKDGCSAMAVEHAGLKQQLTTLCTFIAETIEWHFALPI